MESTHQYSWIIPFISLQVPMLIGMGLLLFSMSTKNLRLIWSFPSVILLSIVPIFFVFVSLH